MTIAVITIDDGNDNYYSTKVIESPWVNNKGNDYDKKNVSYIDVNNVITELFTPFELSSNQFPEREWRTCDIYIYINTLMSTFICTYSNAHILINFI